MPPAQLSTLEKPATSTGILRPGIVPLASHYCRSRTRSGVPSLSLLAIQLSPVGSILNVPAASGAGCSLLTLQLSNASQPLGCGRPDRTTPFGTSTLCPTTSGICARCGLRCQDWGHHLMLSIIVQTALGSVSDQLQLAPTGMMWAQCGPCPCVGSYAILVRAVPALSIRARCTVMANVTLDGVRSVSNILTSYIVRGRCKTEFHPAACFVFALTSPPPPL